MDPTGSPSSYAPAGLARAMREAAAWRGATGESRTWTYGVRIGSRLLPLRVKRFGERVTGRTDHVGDWNRAIAVHPRVAADLDVARIPALDPSTHPRDLALWVVQAGATQADLHAALSAHHGVEHRDPTIDRRVVEVALRQPEWVRRHDGMTRAVVRGAMRDRLPASIALRTRRGEQLPDWLDVLTAARPEVEAELERAREHPLSRRLLDVDRLGALVASWPARDRRAEDRVLREYRLALWRGLVVSRYLRWFESRAARGAA